MDMKKMGKMLLLTGVGGVIISLILYGPNMLQAFGLSCLFTPCGGFGQTEAHHILIWISISLTAVGGIIFTSAKEPAQNE